MATTPTPTAEAVKRARAVLGDEIHRLRIKASLWRSQGGAVGAAKLEHDADELASVRAHLMSPDYPYRKPG